MFNEENFDLENDENEEDETVVYGEEPLVIEEEKKKTIKVIFNGIKNYVINNKKRSAIIAVCALLFVVCVVILAVKLWPQGKNTTVPKKVTKHTASSESGTVTVENPIDFTALQAQNPDICGWISIPGTNVDYPILQSGANKKEDYYLDHTPELKSAQKGSIYIQQINNKSFTDKNTLIYGHNMLNGSMFGTLKYYRKTPGFFDQNSVMYIYTPNKVLTYNIYSAFMYDDRHIMYSFNQFADDKSFQSFIDETLKPKSMSKHVREGVSVTTKDRIVTLSTCAGADNERYLVVGVLTDEQNAVCKQQ